MYCQACVVSTGVTWTTSLPGGGASCRSPSRRASHRSQGHRGKFSKRPSHCLGIAIHQLESLQGLAEKGVLISESFSTRYGNDIFFKYQFGIFSIFSLKWNLTNNFLSRREFGNSLKIPLSCACCPVFRRRGSVGSTGSSDTPTGKRVWYL